VSDTGGQAVCANCEGLVPLVAARQAYVLRAQVTAVPARVPVGVAAGIAMDAPGLASSLQTTAFDGENAAGAPAPVPSPEPDGSPFDHPVAGLALEGSPPVKTTSPADPGGAATTDRQAAAPKGRGAGRRVLELLAIVILVAAGAAAGEYATMVGWLGPVSVHSTVEPVRLGIIGGLLGVLIAWAGIRWTTRKS
jgi:hypothetical protein